MLETSASNGIRSQLGKVLEEAIRCFDIVRSVDTAETTKWKVNIQLLTEVRCCT